MSITRESLHDLQQDGGEPRADAIDQRCEPQASAIDQQGASHAEVIVIGAGLAGLACASELRRAGISPLVLEREPIAGGRLRTAMLDGVPIDLGAHFFSHRYTTLRRLIGEAELEHRLRPIAESYHTGIWCSGRWHYLDYGRRLSAIGYSALAPPHRARLALIAFPLARAARKLRFFDIASAAQLDGMAPARLLGESGLRRVFAPASQAFCGYRPGEISMPLLALGARFPVRAPLTLEGGMGQLGPALAERMAVQADTHVEQVHIEGKHSVRVRARLRDQGELRLTARAAVIATTPSAAVRLWPDAPPAERGLLASARYTQHFHAYLRTRDPFKPTSPQGHPLYMEILPPDEHPGALSHLSFVGSPGSVPHGGLVFLAAHSHLAAQDHDDEALADRLQAEAERLHPELRGQAIARRTIRWPEKVPMFPIGRARELASLRASMRPGPVQLAGDYLYGPLMEGAALSGVAAATRVLRHLESA